MKTEIRELVCILSEKELAERGHEQSEKLLEIVKLEQARRAINEKIKPLNERVDELAHIIVNAMEKRDIECYWFYDWENGIKFLHRFDNDALVCQEPIRDNEKQPELFNQSAAKPVKSLNEASLFEPCPAGPCVMVKTGAVCAPAFCDKQPPASIGNAPFVKVAAETCDHPAGMRFQDSNALICEACGTVLETFETSPVRPVEDHDSDDEWPVGDPPA